MFDFAPTKARRFKIWMPVSAIFCAGGVLIAATAHPLHSPINDTLGIANVQSRVTIPPSASILSLGTDELGVERR